MYVKFVKPLGDFVVALLAFAMLSPLFIITVVGLLVANGGKVFFLQPRPGLHNRIFSVIKFKTMNDRKDAEGNLLSDAERLTLLGRWVRRLSIDEIPQLLNVLIGDMSIVGPRPLLVEYLPLYNEEQALRHSVKPGITGWAQVNGRNAISWEDKFRLDVEYVNKIGFGLDLRILLLTIGKVFKQEGISEEGHATITKFKGS